MAESSKDNGGRLVPCRLHCTLGQSSQRASAVLRNAISAEKKFKEFETHGFLKVINGRDTIPSIMRVALPRSLC